MTDQQEPAPAPEQTQPDQAGNDYDAPAAHAPEADPQVHAGPPVADPALEG